MKTLAILDRFVVCATMQVSLAFYTTHDIQGISATEAKLERGVADSLIGSPGQ